jgi:hypothetical protein
MANRFYWLIEGLKLMIVRDDPAPPLPDALLRVQLRGVGGLRLEHEASVGVPDDGLYGRSFLLCPPVMDDQPPFAGMIRQQANHVTISETYMGS